MTAVKNTDWLDSPWHGFFEKQDTMKKPMTGIPEETLQHISQVFSSCPEDFNIHSGRFVKNKARCMKSQRKNSIFC
jgi:2-oxoglutarate dehydrogenase E1 component